MRVYVCLQMIPHTDSVALQSVLTIADKRLVLIPGADHGYGPTAEQANMAVSAVVAWLREKLGLAPAQVAKKTGSPVQAKKAPSPTAAM